MKGGGGSVVDPGLDGVQALLDTVLADEAITVESAEAQLAEVLAKHPAPTNPAPEAVLAQEKTRRESIRAKFQPFEGRDGVQALLNECLDDHQVSVEAAGDRLLAKLGENCEPVAGSVVVRDNPERARFNDGVVACLLSRAGKADAKTREAANATGQMNLSLMEQAKAALTRAGIDPDIIVSVDPQPVNYYYLESYAGTACLVVDPTTCYLSLRSFPAAKVFVAESPVPIAKYLEQFATRPPGQVAFGGSVSTNAYDLAVQMGCRKIVLLGQDLAFTGGMAHARGAVLEGRILLREERTFRHELHNYRQLSALPVRYLPSRSGGRLPTNDKLAIFHSWFERRFATDIASGIALYNCGSEGAFLAGTKLSSLKEALGPQQPEPWRAPPPLAEPLLNLESLLADLREQLVAFDAFEELSGRAAEQARAAMQNGPGMSQNLQELDRIDERLREFQSTSRIISGAMQRTIFEITERFGDRNATGNALGQSVRLYEALAESCRLHRSWIGRLILSRPHLSPQTSVIGGCD